MANIKELVKQEVEHMSKTDTFWVGAWAGLAVGLMVLQLVKTTERRREEQQLRRAIREDLYSFVSEGFRKRFLK